eukprot:3717021-Rhodomonas_salina.1
MAVQHPSVRLSVPDPVSQYAGNTTRGTRLRGARSTHAHARTHAHTHTQTHTQSVARDLQRVVVVRTCECHPPHQPPDQPVRLLVAHCTSSVRDIPQQELWAGSAGQYWRFRRAM